MKAVICTALGGPSVLKLQEWPSKKPEGDEVRVDMFASGMNFADLLVISGRYQEDWKPPFVLGTEGAGVVAECGPDVKDVKVGDRVLIQNNIGRACHAEELTIPSYRVTKVPDGLRLTDIAGIPINFGTSYYALVNRANVQPGEVVLVHGASGGVGLAAVQIAKMLGATVIATGGDDGKLVEVRKEGADHVINYRTSSFKDRVMELTGGRGADVIYDPVGGDVFDESIRTLVMHGRILVIGFTSGRIPAPKANAVLYKGISVMGAPYGKFSKASPPDWAKMMQTVMRLIVEKKLRPRVHKRFPLSEAATALSLVETRQVVGKCLLMTERGYAERGRDGFEHDQKMECS